MFHWPTILKADHFDSQVFRFSYNSSITVQLLSAERRTVSWLGPVPYNYQHRNWNWNPEQKDIFRKAVNLPSSAEVMKSQVCQNGLITNIIDQTFLRFEAHPAPSRNHEEGY